mmetsp:Transcript_12441/g.29155  ORF Transcript_12441/g.29155 Transcript_12441/m.29155 type:complete len:473 (+) Transcript_12441:2126-3544(+)
MLHEVRLEGGFSDLVQQIQAVVSQKGRQVSEINVDRQGDDSVVCIGLVVVKLALHEGSGDPEIKGDEQRNSHQSLGRDLLAQRHCLEFSVEETGNGEVEGKDHSHVGRPVVETGPEVPLPHGTAGGSHHGRLTEKRIMDQLEKSQVAVPYQINDGTQHRELGADPPLSIVHLVPDPHDSIDHEKVVGVQETNVVENKGGSLRQAQKEDQEIETPQHLQDPDDSVVGLEIKEGKVPKAGHPYVTGDHDPDGVVDLLRMVVVIEQEHELHPSLPLLGLASVQNLGLVVSFCDGAFALLPLLPRTIGVFSVRFVARIVEGQLVVGNVPLPGEGRHHKQKKGQKEEQIGVVVLVCVRIWRMVFANVGVEQNHSKDGRMKQERVDRRQRPNVERRRFGMRRGLEELAVFSREVGTGGQGNGGEDDRPEEHGAGHGAHVGDRRGVVSVAAHGAAPAVDVVVVVVVGNFRCNYRIISTE